MFSDAESGCGCVNVFVGGCLWVAFGCREVRWKEEGSRWASFNRNGSTYSCDWRPCSDGSIRVIHKTVTSKNGRSQPGPAA